MIEHLTMTTAGGTQVFYNKGVIKIECPYNDFGQREEIPSSEAASLALFFKMVVEAEGVSDD